MHASAIYTLITALFWLSAFLVLAGLFRRSRLWLAGQPAQVSWLQLFTIPKRYFVDLHHIVARDPYIARTHVITAGGAVACLVLVAINYGLMLYSSALNWAILAAAAVMLVGVFFVWLRRRNPPARLSRGAWSRLPYTLAAFAAGWVLLAFSVNQLAASVAMIALLLVAIGTLELALGIGAGGPMKHAIAGFLHLAFHPRQARFKGQRSTALAPLALKENDFGITKPSDFKWNQLLGFDACVQCGKCEAACPAFAAGQPLNPKKLVQDIVVGMAGGSDAQYRGSPSPSIAVGAHHGHPQQPMISSLIEAATVWSCTTCRACVEECPMLIEHVDAIVGMRRGITLKTGDVPEKSAMALQNLRDTASVGGFDNQARYHWALDLNVKFARANAPVDVLVFAGESAFDMRAQRTLRALIFSLKQAKVDFALMGDLEQDCGDTARRLGDEVTFQALAKQNINTLQQLTFNTILTADPHVYHCLKNEYPAFGGQFNVVHHTAYLNQLVTNQQLKIKPLVEQTSTTYHDPCYLGRYNGGTAAPRELLKQLGVQVVEMERSGLKSRCCGGGGGAPLSDIPGKQRIPDIRIADANAVNAKVVAVACPQCTAMLEGVVERPEIKDVAELLAAAIESDVV